MRCPSTFISALGSTSTAAPFKLTRPATARARQVGHEVVNRQLLADEELFGRSVEARRAREDFAVQELVNALGEDVPVVAEHPYGDGGDEDERDDDGRAEDAPRPATEEPDGRLLVLDYFMAARLAATLP